MRDKKVKAVVLENNGNMVRVEIKDYGTKEKASNKEIKREMKIIEGDKDWINQDIGIKNNKSLKYCKYAPKK